MTLNLPEREMEFLEAVAAEDDLSKTQVVRQAIRTYQMVRERQKDDPSFVLWPTLPPLLAPFPETESR